MHGKPNVRFVRYADDWCVFITRADEQRAAALRDEIRDFLKDSAGLELSAEKTRITHVRDGFDFLGFRLMKETGQRGILVPKIKVGEKAKKNMRLRLSEAIRWRPHQESVALRVIRASQLIRGWREYFRVAHDLSMVASNLDYHAFWSMVKAACRKSDISTAQCLKRYCRNSRFVLGGGNMLERISGAGMKLDYRGPQPYKPGDNVGIADLDDDVGEKLFVLREGKQRRGGRDLRWEHLRKDSPQCAGCGVLVGTETAHGDHIIPARRFASFREAHRLENLQLLCHRCHQEKTNRDKHSQ